MSGNHTECAIPCGPQEAEVFANSADKNQQQCDTLPTGTVARNLLSQAVPTLAHLLVGLAMLAYTNAVVSYRVAEGWAHTPRYEDRVLYPIHQSNLEDDAFAVFRVERSDDDDASIPAAAGGMLSGPDGVLSSVLATVMGFGLHGALDTFVSQAHGRDGQATRVIGVMAQRAAVLSVISAIPVCLVLSMRGLGNGDDGAKWGFIAYFLSVVLTRVACRTLQSIQRPMVPLFAAGWGALTCLVLNHYFTHSVVSGVYVMALSTAAQLLALVAAVLWSKDDVTFHRHCRWFPVARQAYSYGGLRQLFIVSLPSLAAVFVPLRTLEVFANIAADRISADAAATINLCIAAGTPFLAVAYAVSLSTSVLVGHALGQQRPGLAQQYARAGMWLLMGANAVAALAFVTLSDPIARTLTADEALVGGFGRLRFLAAAVICGYATHYFYVCLLKSVGRQVVSFEAAVVSLWGVGTAAAYYLALPMGYGAAGILGGLCCGFAAGALLMRRLSSSPAPSFSSAWDWDGVAASASARPDDDALLVLVLGGEELQHKQV